MNSKDNKREIEVYFKLVAEKRKTEVWQKAEFDEKYDEIKTEKIKVDDTDFEVSYVISNSWTGESQRIEDVKCDGNSLTKEEIAKYNVKVEGLKVNYLTYAGIVSFLVVVLGGLWYVLKNSEEEAEEESL